MGIGPLESLISVIYKSKIYQKTFSQNKKSGSKEKIYKKTFYQNEKTGYKPIKALLPNEFSRRHFCKIKNWVLDHQKA